jgi:hypothetical protein
MPQWSTHLGAMKKAGPDRSQARRKGYPAASRLLEDKLQRVLNLPVAALA